MGKNTHIEKCASKRARCRKWPQHKAREIRSLIADVHHGWSIYPEQIPAMHRAIKIAIDVEDGTGNGCDHVAFLVLRAVGLAKGPFRKFYREHLTSSVSTP